VRLSVEQSATFYDGSELSKGTVLKLGDMSPKAHRNVEYFNSGLMLVSIFRPDVNVSHADGVASVSFGVTSYGWVGSFSDMLSTFANEPALLIVLLGIMIPLAVAAQRVINRAAPWIEARFRPDAARRAKPQSRKRRPPG
jgi:hypothetical protein